MPSQKHLKDIPILNRPLTTLSGIGQKRAQLFSQKHIYSILDLLFYIPYRYEDRRRLLPIADTEIDRASWVRGEVVLWGEERSYRKGRKFFRIVINDGTGALELIWFNYKGPHLTSFAVKGMELMAYAVVKGNRIRRQMIHPDVVVRDGNTEKNVLGYLPVYGNIHGVSSKLVRSLIRQALDDYLNKVIDAVPGEILKRLNLPRIDQALKNIHLPSERSSIDPLNMAGTEFHRRLLFDRFFYVMINMVYRKMKRRESRGPVLPVPDDTLKRFEKRLPFSLTGDQTRVIRDIIEDLGGEVTMNRLVQGDVGCGKTVVAAASAYAAVSAGYQAAVMAPTQILAQQHYDFFSGLPGELGFIPVLLTGALGREERLLAYERIEKGSYNLVIGTQSLIQEGLSFNKLGLVVIDEQHRFGVRQRSLLRHKGVPPHTLVMTATPIPRSLAMVVYGDTDISLIREYPRDRKAVETHLVKEKQRSRVYQYIMKRLSRGEQALVICPVIDSSEEEDLENAEGMYKKLKGIFSPRFRVALIHGRVPADEKEKVMEQFRAGRIDLLVGTTVVEVGIHAPGATVLVVEHPERFGLAQLHQLRGRVGRGSREGVCALMLSKKVSDESMERLSFLVNTGDGFEIARKDLELRGQGELMGSRQAGAGELDLEEILGEPELLMSAKAEAEGIIESDPELERPEHVLLKKMIERMDESEPEF